MADTIPPSQTIVPGAASQVAIPREPSAAELAVEFKADPDFLLSSDETSAPPGAAEPAPQPEKKTEQSKVEPAKPAEEKKIVAVDGVKPIVPTAPTKVEEKKAEVKKEGAAVPEVKPIAPLASQPKARDYTGFSPEEQNVLKAMSNEAYDYTSKLIKESRELGKLKDSNYLQHPQAYTLSPEYAKLQEDAYYANAESQFWQEQAIKASKGEDWQAITGWDLKTGQPILSAPQKATTEAVENARRYSLHVFNKAQEINNQIQQFSGRYKQQIDNDTRAIQQTCAQYFGWINDPTQLEGKVVNPSIGEKTIKQVREDFIGLFPSYLQNSIGIQVAAHVFAALQIYGQRIHELENNKQVAAVKEEEKALIEPTSREVPAAKVDTNGHARGMWETKEFSTEGMPV